MSSGDRPLSYRWEINGKRVLNPAVLINQAEEANAIVDSSKSLLSIDCPRGAHPGKAYLLMRKEDADSVLAVEEHQVITITEFEQNVDGTWEEIIATGFGGYYALSSSCVFGKIQDQVVVELADERYKFSESHVRKKFNLTIKEASGSTEAEYDPDTLNDGELYSYGEILDEILASTEDPPSLFLPVDPDTPHNLIFDCSVADAIDQLLASIGCALLFDPTAETGEEFSVDELSIEQDIAVLDDAVTEGRLIEKYNPKNGGNPKPKNTIIYPAKLSQFDGRARLIPDLNDSVGSSSTEFPSVVIRDHELEPDVSRIQEAVDAWYQPLEEPRDDVYQGILVATTGSKITSITWIFTTNGHRTFVKNLQEKSIPWPKQPVLIASSGSRRFRAILGEDMTPGDGFAFVTSFAQIEGELPDEPVDVANVMKWYGKEGNVVKVEWNPTFNNGEGEPMGGWEFYAIEVNYTEECFGSSE